MCSKALFLPSDILDKEGNMVYNEASKKGVVRVSVKRSNRREERNPRKSRDKALKLFLF